MLHTQESSNVHSNGWCFKEGHFRQNPRALYEVSWYLGPDQGLELAVSKVCTQTQKMGDEEYDRVHCCEVGLAEGQDWAYDEILHCSQPGSWGLGGLSKLLSPVLCLWPCAPGRGFPLSEPLFPWE